jgi:recombination protein RecT
MPKQKQEIVKLEDNVVSYVDGLGDALSRYAVRSYKQQEFARSAVVAIMSSKELLEISQSADGLTKIENALRAAAVTGLSLNPQLGEAALVVYGNKTDKADYRKVEYQQMKNGVIKIAFESGEIESLVHDYVRENDTFKIRNHVDSDFYEHEPALKSRGEVIGYFAACKLTNGVTRAKYMTREEVDEHAQRYSAAYKSALTTLADTKAEPWRKRAAESSAWIKSFDGMAQKTVIRALLGNLHLAGNIVSMLDSDQQEPLQVVGPATVIEPEIKGVSADKAEAKLRKQAKPKTKPKAEPKAETDQQEGDFV